jgi:predicted dehydrogenase
MASVRFGVLGTAKIAREKVIPALQRGQHTEVVALASRSGERAEAAADALDVPRALGSYEALLAEEAVEAVYIPLPNHLHARWTLRALDAGKHVLCEKPLALNADEAREVADAVRQHPRLKGMEAFMYRHHPQWQRAKALIGEGALGTLRSVEATFSYFKTDPENIRNQPEAGGGALMDIGCYGISVARFLFGRAPKRVLGDAEPDPDLGIDRRTSAMMDFGQGGFASFTSATQQASHQRVSVFGTEGKIEIPIPFSAPPDAPARLLVTTGGETEEVVTEAADQFTRQGDRFARAVLEDSPVPTPLADAVENMRVLDAVRESAEEGAWVTC